MIGPAFFAGGETGLIAGYTAGLWGAYGLQKLSSLYAGSAIRVRRSSDNTEQDIGFSGTALDTSSLSTFVSTNDAFITKWYDQSGGGNDLAQSTTTKQPKIVDAGTYTSELLFDGVDDLMTTANSSGTPTAFTLYIAGRNRAPPQVAVSGTAAYHYQRSTDVGANVSRLSGSDTYQTVVGTGATGFTRFDEESTADGTVMAFVHDAGGGSLTSQNVAYLNGSAQSGIASGGSLATGSFSASTWTLAAASAGTNFARLGLRTFFIFETGHNATTVGNFSALITPSITTDSLDSFTTSLWGVYSIRRQRSSYAGSCLRVRRSSDNTEQDVGFDGTTHLIDTSSMLSFVGANNGFVTKFYDQSGGGNDFVQATTGNQPQIVSSGSYLGWIQFDGVNDFLSTSNNSGTPSAFTIFMKAYMRNMTDSIALEHSTNYNSNDSLSVEPGAASSVTQFAVHQVSAAGYAASRFNTNMVNQVVCYRGDRSASGSANKAAAFNGGLLMTRDANADSGTAPSGTFAAKTWTTGSRSGGSTFQCALNLKTLVIYETAVTDADVERISRKLG